MQSPPSIKFLTTCLLVNSQASESSVVNQTPPAQCRKMSLSYHQGAEPLPGQFIRGVRHSFDTAGLRQREAWTV